MQTPGSLSRVWPLLSGSWTNAFLLQVLVRELPQPLCVQRPTGPAPRCCRHVGFPVLPQHRLHDNGQLPALCCHLPVTQAGAWSTPRTQQLNKHTAKLSSKRAVGERHELGELGNHSWKIILFLMVPTQKFPFCRPKFPLRLQFLTKGLSKPARGTSGLGPASDLSAPSLTLIHTSSRTSLCY